MHRFVESLERRALLSAVVAGNTLYVTGTAGNDVIIVEQLKDKSVAVTDNGKKTSFKAYAFNTLSVQTDAGKDSVTLTGAVLPKGGSIYTGGGEDTVTLTSVNINADFVVDTGDDADAVTLNASTFEGVAIKTGGGNDVVNASDVTVYNYATVQTGVGNDALIVARTSVYGFATVDLGAGTDSLTGNKLKLPSGSGVLGVEIKFIA